MILDTQERIDRYNREGWWGQKTLLDCLRGHVEAQPETPCLLDPPNKGQLTGYEPEKLTYRELWRAVEATAEGLMGLGLTKDDIVLVQLPNCWDLAMLYLAIARAGGLISPVPMQWRFSELRYIAQITGARFYITSGDFHGFDHLELGARLQAACSGLERVLGLEEIRALSRRAPAGGEGAVELDANDIFTLCWTSGTEAEPKGCPLSHNNWIFTGTLEIELTGIRAGERLLTAGPLVNMASVGTTFIPWLIAGGTFVLHHPFDPVVWLTQMIEERINYTLLVPAVVNAIAKHPLVDQFDLSHVRSITIGGAPPSLWSASEFERRWAIEIGNIWGMNEGTGMVSGALDSPDLKRRIEGFPHYGKPGTHWKAQAAMAGQARIIDPVSGEELSEEGSVGELIYRGPNTMSGYFRRPDLNQKAFDNEGFFHTGDFFRIIDGDFISFYDRAKDIIIRGGFNISAQGVENLLLEHPGIQDVAAVAMPDERLGERVCVYVVTVDSRELTLEDITSFMQEKGVAVYKLPERLEIIDAIPRNPVGKILKNLLREDIKKKLQSV